MEKRLIIALALSLGILLIFQTLGPKKQSVIPKKIESAEVSKNEIETIKERKVIGAKEDLTEIQTEKYELIFSDIGAGLKKIVLKEYSEEKKEQVLYDAQTTGEDLFVLSGGVLSGLENEKFESTKERNTLEYVFKEPGAVEVRKKYIFYNSLDQIQLDVEIKNLAERIKGFSYQITGPTGLTETTRIAGRSFYETDSLIDGKMWKVKNLKNTQERSGDISWVGAKNRYFTLILKPIDPPKSVIVSPIINKKTKTSIKSQDYEIAPGGSIRNTYLIYAGPLSEKKLEETGYQMEEIIDYGFFGVVSKKLLSILRFFHKRTKNWGLAIIFLTLLINAILFPLTLKSFSSMQKMKKVQPHIQKLRDIHKDNPQKLNKEMMELYKKYNVNPLGGCLPMLLQMPIFIALYQGLMRSVELKGAHFLWIKDLSRPDAIPLPFSLPVLGNHLNLLPLLMVGMMVMQQKITQSFTPGAATEEQAKQQKMMMLMMPLFFGFLFYRMPSGLVLYWLTNTILMTGEQAFISKRSG